MRLISTVSRYIPDIVRVNMSTFFSFIDCRGSRGNLLELDASLEVF